MCYNISMDDEKFSLKEEIKKELRESSQSGIKEEDLIVDEAVVDNYTSSVFERYKKGLIKNKWFAWAGGLSIVFGVLAILIMAVVAIVFLTKEELILSPQDDYNTVRSQIITSSIIVPIIGIIAILVGIKVKSYAKYSKDKLIDHIVSFCFVCALQFIFGGIFPVVLTVIGYFVGIGTDYGAIYYNRIDNPSTQYRRLADAKKLYEDGVIDYQEYQSLKQYILREINFE